MGTSIFLAKAFGVYFIVVAIFMLVNKEVFQQRVKAVMESQAALFVLAVVTFMLGIILVLVHSVWVLGWPLMITIICWLTFIKGVLRVVYPQIDQKWARYYDSDKALYITGVSCLLLGLILAYFGWCYSM